MARKSLSSRIRSRRARGRSVASVESPESGRWIRVGGPAYQDLLRMGYTASDIKRGGVRRRKQASRRYSSRSGQSKPTRHQRKMRVSRASRSSTRGRSGGGGSRTRGWSKAAPRRGRPRHRVMKECGPKCFLDPEHEAFPICARQTGRSSRCELDCRGIKSALVRARQYGYTNIARAADKLYREKCGGK